MKDKNKKFGQGRKSNEERKAEKRARNEKRMIQEMEAQRDAEERKILNTISESQSEIERKEKGRAYTVSMALPGSILDNAQSCELRTYLAGQIARAAVVFNVDEVVIFDETGSGVTVSGEFEGVGKKGNCNTQMARILQYLECPQYLRKSFFPQHKDLQYAGLLNPLDSPHHPSAEEATRYREGVVMRVPSGNKKQSLIDVGLKQWVAVEKVLEPCVRVTVDMGSTSYTTATRHVGKVVNPNEPRLQQGLYWGYSVRLADSLGAVFTQCPHSGGYDATIGTSERGESVDGFTLPPFKHLLIVFGGVHGLEASLDADQNLNIDDPALLFNHYLNTCPQQGSNTIRTEEAILISMSALRPKILSACAKEPAS